MNHKPEQLEAFIKCYTYLLSLPDQQIDSEEDRLSGDPASSEPTKQVEGNQIVAEPEMAVNELEGDL